MSASVSVPSHVRWIAVSEDGGETVFDVPWEQASASLFVRNFYGDDGDHFEVSADRETDVFRLEMDPEVMREVVTYLANPAEEAACLARWSLRPHFLIEVAKASNFLNIPELMNHAARAIADLIRGKSPSEVRAIFGMPEDPAAEEAARMKLQWLLE